MQIKSTPISLKRFNSVPYVLATVRYGGNTGPQDAMNMWLEEKQEDHFRICVREVKTFDGKHQNTQVVSKLWLCHTNVIFFIVFYLLLFFIFLSLFFNFLFCYKENAHIRSEETHRLTAAESYADKSQHHF